MKLILSALLGLCLAFIVSASPFIAVQVTEQRPAECAKGSAYWCQSFPNAKACGAMKHCIQAVWEKHTYPVDNDSICKICKDMVGQARDQLRSNETQADLKAVFEGTCDLIRVKMVRTECDKLADDFVPELVEALSSQMNPDVVCSVAGLCNNAAIDAQLAQIEASQSTQVAAKANLFSCKQCGQVSSVISNKFQQTDRDQVLDNMLGVCGRFGSFSDGCSNIVLSYFNEIYDHLKGNLNKDSLCHMSGACSEMYHQHEEQVGDDQETSEEDSSEEINFDLALQKGDDIPCDLCKQLIVHLRDILTANTTEAEFKQVLEGICKQTKSFKAECLSITDQYYDVIYNTLTKELDPAGACFMIGVCPKGYSSAQVYTQKSPLLPVRTIQAIQHQKKVLGADEPVFSAQQVQQFQLPIDKLMFGGEQMAFDTTKPNTQYCALCEYFLHFIQEALATPKNEENIKRAVAQTCQRLPKTIVGQCQSFVNQYGDALIALLIQDIDPASVCPSINVCERTYTNGQCPLCLFAFQEAEALIENNRTQANIESKLNVLCDHLPEQLKDECTEFIHDNSKALIDSLLKKYTPEKACIRIHMCTPQEEMFIYALGSKRTNMEIETNEIEDNTFNGREKDDIEISSPECLLCEQLMKEVEKKASSDKSREHIEEVLEHSCESLPNAKLRQACIVAIKKNSDFIITAIIKNVTPKEICIVLAFCIADNKPAPAPKSDPQCVLCELVMEHLEKELKNKKNIEEIEQTVINICNKLPKTVTKNCATFIKQYGDLIISLATKVSPKEICTEISLCTKVEDHVVAALEAPMDDVLECAVCHAAADAMQTLIKQSDSSDRVAMSEKACNALPAKYYNRCNKFLSIYFESLHNLLGRNVTLVDSCEQMGMCFKNEGGVTLGDNEMTKPPKEQMLIGASKCTYGPAYWCHNDENMNECNAHSFCLKKFKTPQVVTP